MSELKDLREKLNMIDEELVRFMSKRMEVIREIVKVKSKMVEPIKDSAREAEVLKHVEKIARKHNLSPLFAKKLFREIINYSLSEEVRGIHRGRKETPVTVVFQGKENSYSYLALQHCFSGYENTRALGCRTFREVVTQLISNAADYAILPLENTTAGSINEVYSLLLENDLSIVGEEIWRVEHCLIGCEETPLPRIKKILSHPQAIAQCGNFLATMPWAHAEGFFDTAGAVEKVAEDRDPHQAAIGSVESAEALGLFVLQRNIANQEENYTRFVVLARQAEHYDARIPCKTSLVLATRHEKGALLKCLQILSNHGLNMTKLESRPRPNKPWEYLFYLDFEGNTESPNVNAALDELKAASLYFKALGSYPAKALPKEAAITQISQESAPQIIGHGTSPGDKKKGEEKTSQAATKSKQYKLVSRDYRSADTLVSVSDILIGGKGFVVMAGPCSVESREQIMETARYVKEHGAHILRGGVFKPRTSPYSFQGMEWEGLRLLHEAGREYGLPIITEVLAPEQVKEMAKMTDILQIGARNMQNFPLLREAGRVDKPILLKRGLMSTLEELLAAAEYIVSQGNGQVILCERGIRTFETATRNTLDLSAVPVLAEKTHLPVIIDPSHGTGKRNYVEPMSLAARAAGAHGLLIEVHPDPDKALSDGDQSITFEQFSHLMSSLQRLKIFQ